MADHRLDRIGTECFGEASGRSNEPFEKKDQKSVRRREGFFFWKVERTESEG